MNEFTIAENTIHDFDPSILPHLRKWLQEYQNGDTLREIIYKAMVQFIADDVEYWSAQNWTLVFDRAGCNEIRKQYIEDCQL